jgi:AcrR family transcriptional regulator
VLESPKTAKGRATRERIVIAAGELVFTRGVAETSLDLVLARAGASKSQLYHYFEDRSALLRAVVEENTEDPEATHAQAHRPPRAAGPGGQRDRVAVSQVRSASTDWTARPRPARFTAGR